MPSTKNQSFEAMKNKYLAIRSRDRQSCLNQFDLAIKTKDSTVSIDKERGQSRIAERNKRAKSKFTKEEAQIKAAAFTEDNEVEASVDTTLPIRSHRISSLPGVFEDRDDAKSNASKKKRVRISDDLPSSK